MAVASLLSTQDYSQMGTESEIAHVCWALPCSLCLQAPILDWSTTACTCYYLCHICSRCIRWAWNHSSSYWNYSYSASIPCHLLTIQELASWDSRSSILCQYSRSLSRHKNRKESRGGWLLLRDNKFNLFLIVLTYHIITQLFFKTQCGQRFKTDSLDNSTTQRMMNKSVLLLHKTVRKVKQLHILRLIHHQEEMQCPSLTLLISEAGETLLIVYQEVQNVSRMSWGP